VGSYVVKVPKCDADGNDLGCLLPAEVGVPLATFTGWNLRKRDAGAEGMLASLMGSYIPFAKTVEERKQSGDPRRAIQERYRDHEDYVKQFTAYCDKLVKERYLLPEDAEKLIRDRQPLRSLFPASKR
jgi:hypothetical protein